jgi:hypothetical protein
MAKPTLTFAPMRQIEKEIMSEEISDYDKLILDPEEQSAVTTDEQSAAVESPAGEKGSVPKGEIDDSEKYIATPDDQRKIPFKVLKDALNDKIEIEQKYQNLVSQIEAFKNGQGVATPVISQEALDKLAELKEYDEEAAIVFEKTLNELATAAARAAQFEQAELAKQQQTAAQAEAQQQAIIESYPNLKAMQQDPETWAQAGKIYDSFYENPVTAQLPESEKIAKLNQVMTAMLGVPAQPQTKATPPAVAPQAQMPFSLSDLGSGVIPSEKTGSKSIEEMSSFELQKWFETHDYDDLPSAFG